MIQLKSLSEDFEFLKHKYQKTYVLGIGVISFLVLPAIVIGHMYYERSVLHQALDGVNAYSLVEDQKMPNTKSLKNVLQHIEKAKNRNFINESEGQQPIITPLYKTLVLDNLMLSQTKLSQLKAVYLPKDSTEFTPSFGLQNANERTKSSNTSLDLINAQVTSVWKDDFYESSIDFTTTNSDMDNQEFAAILDLPMDAFITDDYLMIEDEKVPGILAERKAAEWIYNEITNANRDPGIMRYISPNKVLLQIFPFSPNQTRKSGFKIIHKNPFELNFCNKRLQLGNEDNLITKPIEIGEKAYYLTSQAKERLPEIQLKPEFYYFIYKGISDAYKGFVKSEIQKNQLKYPNANHFAVITDFNTEIISLKTANSWLNNTQVEGGYFAEKAIKKILNKTRKSTECYPVFILFEGETKAAFPVNDLEQYNAFLWNQKIQNAETLHKTTFKPISAKLFQENNTKVAVPNDAKSSLIVQEIVKNDEKNMKSKDWESGMQMRVNDAYDLFHLENIDENWLNSLKASFATQLLNKNTAFIALENEAQRKLLRKKQEDILNGKYGLDAGEERRMSEPYFLVFILLIFGITLFRIKH